MDPGSAVGVQIHHNRRVLPDFLQSVNLKYVKLGYHYLITNLFTLCIIPLIIITFIELSQLELHHLAQLWFHLKCNLLSVLAASAFLIFGLTSYIMTRPRPVYLVDFACYRPPDHLKAPFHRFMEHSRLTGDFDDSSLEFQRKILERSGLGDDSYVPEAMHFVPPRPTMAAAREEAEQVMFGALDNLFLNTQCRSHCGGSCQGLAASPPEYIRCCGEHGEHYSELDDAGKTGVSLSKDLMAIAGGALKTNITTLGPLVLPISEQLLFFATLLMKKLFKADVKPYIPDFNLAFDHFCIHAGGRAVIDELEKNLQLLPEHVEASRMTLHRFGNTSSSSIWYELAYIEAKARMRKGNRVWQIAFGSGFKCNSAVWEALHNVRPSPNGPWEDCIDNYPVKLID
ncbi:hypothetical protein K1719_015833 [Acacia pycnantha]|nr:hypothetical protein K1719_015833 [Acacia pycnantha]